MTRVLHLLLSSDTSGYGSFDREMSIISTGGYYDFGYGDVIA